MRDEVQGMTDFENLVKDKLNERNEDAVIALWEDLYKAYERDGSSAVEKLVLDKLSELKKEVNKEMKEINGVIPKKRKKGR